MLRRPASLGFAVAILIAISSLPVHAAGRPRLLPLDPPRVRAGQVLELRWEGIPSNAEELEILLSVDGGRHFAVRVSAELDPRSGGFRWRVPNLPTMQASLRMRYGDAHGEHETEASQCFEIVADERRPLDLAQIHEGAWWSGVDSADLPSRRAALGCGEGPELIAAQGACSAAEPPREPLHLALRPGILERVSDATTLSSPTQAPDLSGVPRFVPLRE